MIEAGSAPVAIVNGLVYDGSGGVPQALDVLVSDQVISQIGEPGSFSDCETVIDASGCAVAPGFIDLHTHADFSIPQRPAASSMVRQGVTTITTGNCGFSPFPVGPGDRAATLRDYTSLFCRDLDWRWDSFKQYVDYLESVNPAINIAPLIGHGSVRIAAMGFDRRAPTNAELSQMSRLVDEIMAEGAFGMSTGLIYAPGTYASTEELVALATVVSRYDGFYASHMRNEGDHLLKSVEETLSIARRAKIGLQISHHKVIGRRNWGLTVESLALIDKAIADGMDVVVDQYPYTASATSLRALLPTWSLEGGTEVLRERLADPAVYSRIRAEVLDGPGEGLPKRDFEPETIMISSVDVEPLEWAVGSTIDELSKSRAVDPVDLMLELVAQDPGLEVVINSIGDDDIDRVMSHPAVSIASDGWTMDPSEGGQPHPRSYGTFARVLGHYVRERKVLELSEAIRKMTSLPAGRLGLTDRGMLRAGLAADIVVFDPALVHDEATYLSPHRFASGVTHVFVNGVPAVADGQGTDGRGGKVLRRMHPVPAA